MLSPDTVDWQVIICPSLHALSTCELLFCAGSQWDRVYQSWWWRRGKILLYSPSQSWYQDLGRQTSEWCKFTIILFWSRIFLAKNRLYESIRCSLNGHYTHQTQSINRIIHYVYLKCILFIWFDDEINLMHLNDSKNIGKNEIAMTVDNTAICECDNLNQKYCII